MNDPIARPWCSCCPLDPYWVLQEQIGLLTKAIQSGSFAARPSKLRSGAISYVSDHELSETETDRLWEDTFGHTD